MTVVSDWKNFRPHSISRYSLLVLRCLEILLQIIGNKTLENQKWEEILESLPPRQRRGLVPGRNTALLKELSTYVDFRQEKFRILNPLTYELINLALIQFIMNSRKIFKFSRSIKIS